MTAFRAMPLRATPPRATTPAAEVAPSCRALSSRRRAGRWAGAVVALSASLAIASPASAQTEISFWFAMTGALADRVNALAAEFNASQTEYRVVPSFKGSYAEAMTATIAAARSGNAPDIVQIFEVGTATMMAARGVIKPVEQMMREAGEKFDRKAYVPAVAGYYTSPKGEMLSFPFNSSTAVFYYNKDAFAKAGIDKVPETWPEVASAAARIKAAGAAPCSFTTGWQAWTQVENFSAWHNVPIASANNGFDSVNVKMLVDTPLHLRHLTNLANWSKSGLFTYAGRSNEPEARFFAGDCAMLTSSSAAYANIKRNAKFNFGISKLPYYADVPGAPQNTIIGGASLWVMNGKSAETYKGVAKFFSFLSGPEVQAKWHQETGYLPLTLAAYELTRKSGFYEKNPGLDVPVEQMIGRTTDKSRGVRLGNFVQIRDIVDQEFESVWAGKQEPAAALKRIEERANDQLARFARTVRN